MNDLLEFPKFKGSTPSIPRISTGLYSLDVAIADRTNLGICLRSMYELYGSEHSGKSTLALYLASIVNKSSSIAYMDLEYVLDKKWALRTLHQYGFTGTLHSIEDTETKKKRSVLMAHADMAENALHLLGTEEYSTIIIDSIGTWIPRLEAKSKVGESVIGRRAMEIGQFTGRSLGLLREVEDPKIIIMVNHVLPKIGGQGHYTPGGKKKGYGSNARLMMWRDDNTYDNGCFEAAVKAEKLRYGGKTGKIGYVYIVPHLGVSVGMTALLDAIRYEWIENNNGWIRVPGEDKPLGRKGEFENAAYNGDTEQFRQILDIMEKVRSSSGAIEETSEGTDTSTMD